MSRETVTAIRDLYDSLAAREYDAAAKLVAEDVLLLNVATGDVYRGRDGYLTFMRGWSAAFPDLEIRLLKISADDQRAVAEYELVGNQTGSLVTPRGHIPPTGMEMQLRCCDVLELEGDDIKHVRTYFDTSTLLRQLGLVPGSPLHTPDRRAALELYAQPVDGVAPERNKAIVSRFIQEALNRQNPHAAVDSCAKDYRWHGGTLGETKGLTSYQAMLAELFAAFPDFEVQVLDLVAERDRVVTRFTTSGTHRGEFRGISPTSNRISWDGMATYRIADSRIVEEWWQADVLLMLQQLDAGRAHLRPAN